MSSNFEHPRSPADAFSSRWADRPDVLRGGAAAQATAFGAARTALSGRRSRDGADDGVTATFRPSFDSRCVPQAPQMGARHRIPVASRRRRRWARVTGFTQRPTCAAAWRASLDSKERVASVDDRSTSLDSPGATPSPTIAARRSIPVLPRALRRDVSTGAQLSTSSGNEASWSVQIPAMLLLDRAPKVFVVREKLVEQVPVEVPVDALHALLPRLVLVQPQRVELDAHVPRAPAGATLALWP